MHDLPIAIKIELIIAIGIAIMMCAPILKQYILWL